VANPRGRHERQTGQAANVAGIARTGDVAAMIRVDHAAICAVRIYEGQLAVLDGRPAPRRRRALSPNGAPEQEHLKASTG